MKATQQQWKFKPQTIPTNTNTTAPAMEVMASPSPSSPAPSSQRGGSSNSRKRRHSEPHIQDNQNAYKHYVTHWKLPTNCTNTNTANMYTTYNTDSTPHNTIYPNTTTSTANTIKTIQNLTIDVGASEEEDWKGSTSKQTFPRSPQVYRPSPISPTLSPHAIPPSPSPPNHSDSNIQHWNHEPIKSMFHPYKRDPLSPSSENKLAAMKDRRRNSAPHIYHPNPAPYLDNRLETIPELSFPSRLQISPPQFHPPPPMLAPLGSIPPSFSTKHYAPLQTHIPTHKRPHEHLQVNPTDPENSLSLLYSSESSSPPTNTAVDDIPKFARNTRRRMSVDNLLA